MKSTYQDTLLFDKVLIATKMLYWHEKDPKRNEENTCKLYGEPSQLIPSKYTVEAS